MRKLFYGAVSIFASLLAIAPVAWAQGDPITEFTTWFLGLLGVNTATLPTGTIASPSGSFFYIWLPLFLIFVILNDILRGLNLFKKYTSTVIAAIITLMTIPLGLNLLVTFLYGVGAVSIVLLMFVVIFYAAYHRAIQKLRLETGYIGWLTPGHIALISVVAWAILGAFAGFSMGGPLGFPLGLAGGGLVGGVFGVMGLLQTRQPSAKKTEKELNRINKEISENINLRAAEEEKTKVLGALLKVAGDILQKGGIKTASGIVVASSGDIPHDIRVAYAKAFGSNIPNQFSRSDMAVWSDDLRTARNTVDSITAKIEELNKEKEGYIAGKVG